MESAKDSTASWTHIVRIRYSVSFYYTSSYAHYLRDMLLCPTKYIIVITFLVQDFNVVWTFHFGEYNSRILVFIVIIILEMKIASFIIWHCLIMWSESKWTKEISCSSIHYCNILFEQMIYNQDIKRITSAIYNEFLSL